MAICLASLVVLSACSSGDESIRFRSCLAACMGDGISSTEVGLDVPRCGQMTQRFLWNCEADCQYRCMWSIEGLKRDSSGDSKRVEKYYGKWPFVRLGPMQEPASVLLSLLNLLANVLCLKALLGTCLEKRIEVYTWKNMLWIAHFVLAINAWLWSSVFHTRDVVMTERFDYFSAGAVMVLDVYLSCCRVFQITSVRVRIISLAILLAGYARHMYYMHVIKFDYGYHVGLCVIAGIVQSVAWIVWMGYTKEGKDHPGRKFLGTFVVAVNLAVLLEVLDFPPFFDIVDAHALWHLATVPLTFVFYKFVARDIEVLGRNKIR